MSNSYIKSLVVFDPKRDLEVNENFKIPSKYAASDSLSELGNNYNSNTGKEFASLKTSSPIKTGLIKINNNLNKTIFFAGNTHGECFLFTPEQNELKILSKFKIQGSIVNRPVEADGIVYIATREGILYAINTALKDLSGAIKPEVLWQKKVDKGILADPIATGKLLIVCSLSDIYGFEAYYQDRENKSIGKMLWKTALSGIVTSPVIDSGMIFIGTKDKDFYALEYGGKKLTKAWSYKSSGEIRSKPYISKLRSMVLVAATDGNFNCFDKKSGKLLWFFYADAPILSQATSLIYQNDELFFIGSDNGFLYCINSYGKKQWEFRTNGKIRTEPVIHDNKIYFGCEDNNIYGLNALNGQLIFKFPTDGNVNGSLVIEDNIIYFGSTDSFIYAIYS